MDDFGYLRSVGETIAMGRLPLAFDTERYRRNPYPLSAKEWAIWVENQSARHGGISPWLRIKPHGT